LPVHQQGGPVYLKLIYDIVFNMTASHPSAPKLDQGIYKTWTA
jgi:hypothetical protein